MIALLIFGINGVLKKEKGETFADYYKKRLSKGKMSLIFINKKMEIKKWKII